MTSSSIQSGIGNQPAGGWPASQSNDVTEAADKIESLVNSDGAFEWADTNEVTEAANTLAKLPSQEADSVVDELARRGSLETFANEVTDKSWVGPGLSADNRATLFDNFAKQLDAESLLKVSDAFRAAGTPRDGDTYAQELTEAINTHTSPAAKAELVELLAERAENNTGTGAEALAQRREDREQAADILASLSSNGTHFETAIQKLEQADMLDDVLRASVQTEYHITMGRITHTTYDTSRFDVIMEGVADSTDSRLKKDVFAAGITAMEAVDAEANPAVEVIRDGVMPSFNDEAANEMADSLTKILDSDAEGVMDELTYGSNTNNGKAFTAYAKQMLEAGETDKLGEIYTKLQLGNDLNGDATQRLETVTTIPGSGSEIQPHADALGHFVGSIYAASKQITSDQAKQAEYATIVIKAAMTTLDKSKIGGPVVGGIVSVAKESVSLSMKEALITQDLSAAQIWEAASIPTDPLTGRQSIGRDAFSALTDRIDHIFRLNQ